jgi:hypothetical protein
MRKAKETFRKILRKIYIGLGLTTAALVFQACYGTPMELDILVRGVVKSKITNTPIGGIQVSVKDPYQYDLTLTDNDGEFWLYVPKEEICIIQLDDIDGTENGSYSSTKISVDSPKEKMDLGDILLDDAE